MINDFKFQAYLNNHRLKGKENKAKNNIKVATPHKPVDLDQSKLPPQAMIIKNLNENDTMQNLKKDEVLVTNPQGNIVTLPKLEATEPQIHSDSQTNSNSQLNFYSILDLDSQTHEHSEIQSKKNEADVHIPPFEFDLKMLR